MTEGEWATSNDAVAMITALQELYADDLPLFKRMLHRYYLACCRAIWKLLPDEYSRNGVVVAERYLQSQADDADLGDAEWLAEGAAFGIDYRTTDELEEWIKQTEAIPTDELKTMIHPPEAIAGVSADELLEKAAYFAHFAVLPNKSEHTLPYSPKPYLFLSPKLLREIFGNPYARRPKSGG